MLFSICLALATFVVGFGIGWYALREFIIECVEKNGQYIIEDPEVRLTVFAMEDIRELNIVDQEEE